MIETKIEVEILVGIGLEARCDYGCMEGMEGYGCSEQRSCTMHDGDDDSPR